LEDRLKRQDGEHHGGSQWIGTGGTSPFGHSGYHPAGVRIGGKSLNHSAVKVAAERHYQEFRDDQITGVRQFEVALRKLRQFSSRAEGPRDELDLDGTIVATCKNAGTLKLVCARVRGYEAGRFSFNVKGGRCENCEGGGLIKIEMHFLPDVYVECEVCRGKRYNRETLEITYKGKNIADVLDLSVDEAARFFRNVPTIAEKLNSLLDVGLGYLRLGQAGTTLSGGEAQRVKLATELAKKATGRTVYILDEPTTGLHFADIEKLLEVLMKLRNAGNTIVVIEHNLEMIKCADWIIDLGPEGGEDGGKVVGSGPPERVATIPASHTGQYLRAMLERK
jgi:hypothetical protein